MHAKHAKHRRHGNRRPRRAVVLTAVVTLAVGLTSSPAYAVTGNISPLAIEIEKAGQANLTAGTADANVYNPLANHDWVSDAIGNTGTGCLVGSIASCNQAGVTSAVGGLGHWNGVRIVDGISGDDQDIFRSGGKEDDTTTWNVGPGSVGSSKYDATQMYLANNTTDLFFGMERSGNTGTTAFDFEFNRNAPAVAGSYVPTRTVGDPLFTFEMQGSGSSGSVTAHFFRWNGSAFATQALPAGTFASINDNTTTAGEPWGHVDSHGDWVLGNLDRNTFAEAIVSLANVFPDFTVCGGDSAYVQIRTRSSSTPNSDLKDTTKIFNYEFSAPLAPSTQLASTCTQTFTYNSPGSASSYDWDFTVSAAQALAGVTLGGTGVTGPTTAANGDQVYGSSLQSGTVTVTLPAGVASATIQVSQATTDAANCVAGDGPYSVTVYKVLGVTATLAALCDNQFTYTSTVTGGKAPYTYAWTFQRNVSGTWTDVGTSSVAGGTFNAGVAGAYRALLTVTDTADTSSIGSVTAKPVCTANATTNTVNVFPAVGGSTSLATTCDAPDVLSYSATGTGGNGTYTYAWTVQKLVAANTWATAHTFSDGPTSGSSTGALDVDSFAVLTGDGVSRALVTITDTQGLNCTSSPVSNQIEAAHLLGATAAKTGANASTGTANLAGNATSGGLVASGSSYAYQWQKSTDGLTWTNLAGATGVTLAYTGFAADAVASTETVTIGSGNAAGTYDAQLWVVFLRLHVTRTINGGTCTASSPAVTVKKLVAVDP